MIVDSSLRSRSLRLPDGEESTASCVVRSPEVLPPAIYARGILGRTTLPTNHVASLRIVRRAQESKFISVLAGPLKGVIGLSDKEICDLTDYFRIQDGRILYSQFCEVIHDSVPDFGKNKALVTGLEWENPLHINVLSGTETRKLNLIITQIAVLVSKRKIALWPYFQDYELIAKNVGTVTLAHFGRILKFLGIVLGAEEFRLLVKRFAKDAYTVNYVAFVKAVDEVQHYLEEYGMVDLSGELLDQFPGRIITAELPKLPRPEIGKIIPSQVFGKQTVFHPVMEQTREMIPALEVIKRIQRHILEQRIRIHEFFKDFEYLNVGRVTISQFRRALDALQISSLGRLWLIEPEIDALIALYRDLDDPDRVCWRVFEDDIDQVFTVKGLDKLPNLKVESPPQDIAELPRKGVSNWQCQPKNIRDLCEDIMQRVRQRVEERRIFLKQFFKDYDKHNCGHVTRTQFRQVLIIATILLSPEEEFALEKRYNDDMGFNYTRFLQELEFQPIVEPLYYRMLEDKKRLNAERSPSEPHEDETNIVLILAKIKAKVVRERIKVLEFMRQFDRHNQLVVSKLDFIRGLDELRCGLTTAEIDTITKLFQAPLKPYFIEYTKFAAIVEEAVATRCLEKVPLVVPLQHVPSEADSRTFLNFDERQKVAIAMDKLCQVRSPNLEEIFKDYDKENTGTVSKGHLIRTLSVRRMLEFINSNELDAVHKCFSTEKNSRLEFNYRAFLCALHLLQENKKKILPL
ncbi:PREDICTED: uncharacterized protein LOC108759052 isoform X1 [Trachymyrmex cornetzi]|uniref:uncharacterized protein LOC108759052 isoform X1 n=1 Tax=Trachymyrmex cornetzi TaxID=471704 RepID=UPI00084EDB44|nr:PREDICTED: uncharacterized protein LOC108759052 isoform X1 [Trachymyrmex cornetzi]